MSDSSLYIMLLTTKNVNTREIWWIMIIGWDTVWGSKNHFLYSKQDQKYLFTWQITWSLFTCNWVFLVLYLMWRNTYTHFYEFSTKKIWQNLTSHDFNVTGILWVQKLWIYIMSPKIVNLLFIAVLTVAKVQNWYFLNFLKNDKSSSHCLQRPSRTFPMFLWNTMAITSSPIASSKPFNKGLHHF